MGNNLEICHKDTCVNATGNLAVALTTAITFAVVCYGINLFVKAIR